jgi:hypothetical protein
MVELNAIAGLVTSSVNASIKLAEYTLHFIDVPDETRDFLMIIELVEQNIKTARRLRRDKSAHLDAHTKADAEANIKKAEEVVELIGKTIENCRVDLQINGRVGVANRLKWIMRDHRAFLSKERILNISLQSLTCSINQMSNARSPDNPRSYRENMQFRRPLRGPHTRKKLAKQMEEDEEELYATSEGVNSLDLPSGSTWDDDATEVDDSETWPSYTAPESTRPSVYASSESSTRMSATPSILSISTQCQSLETPGDPEPKKRRRRCSAIR